MKPFVIEFENGFSHTSVEKTLEELRKSTGDFAKYGIKKDGKFETCFEVPFTVRNATDDEIELEWERRDDIREEYEEITARNKAIIDDDRVAYTRAAQLATGAPLPAGYDPFNSK